MLFLRFQRRIQKWWSKAPWLTLLALLAALYVVGYGMMLWQEPASSAVRSLSNYTGHGGGHAATAAETATEEAAVAVEAVVAVERGGQWRCRN